VNPRPRGPERGKPGSTKSQGAKWFSERFRKFSAPPRWTRRAAAARGQRGPRRLPFSNQMSSVIIPHGTMAASLVWVASAFVMLLTTYGGSTQAPRRVESIQSRLPNVRRRACEPATVSVGAVLRGGRESPQNPGGDCTRGYLHHPGVMSPSGEGAGGRANAFRQESARSRRAEGSEGFRKSSWDKEIRPDPRRPCVCIKVLYMI